MDPSCLLVYLRLHVSAAICIRKRAGTVASRHQAGQRLLIHHIDSTKARQRCNDGGMVLRGGLQINKKFTAVLPHDADLIG